MNNGIPNRLKQISKERYDNNDSAFARDVEMTPQSLYRYMKGLRQPSANFLIQLAEMGIDVTWLLTGEGEMLYTKEERARVAEPAVDYQATSEKVDRMLQIIVQRLNEVDYKEEIKLEILRETLNRIVIEQNTHFVERELNNTQE